MSFAPGTSPVVLESGEIEMARDFLPRVCKVPISFTMALLPSSSAADRLHNLEILVPEM